MFPLSKKFGSIRKRWKRSLSVEIISRIHFFQTLVENLDHLSVKPRPCGYLSLWVRRNAMGIVYNAPPPSPLAPLWRVCICLWRVCMCTTYNILTSNEYQCELFSLFTANIQPTSWRGFRSSTIEIVLFLTHWEWNLGEKIWGNIIGVTHEGYPAIRETPRLSIWLEPIFVLWRKCAGDHTDHASPAHCLLL